MTISKRSKILYPGSREAPSFQLQPLARAGHWNCDPCAAVAPGYCMPDLHPGRLKAFTLIELILVMTVLTIPASITAPALANFFRGRTLDSEARRILALTRQGQNRAVSEGLPMELWL